MDRRRFMTHAGSVSALSLVAAQAAPAAGDQSAEADQRAAAAEGSAPQVTFGAAPGPVLTGSPVVTGPAPDAMVVLQPVSRHATGYLEYAIDDGPMQRVDATSAGMLPLEPHVLKFQLPALPPGRTVRYRTTAHSVGWVQVRQYVHGELITGPSETSETRSFRTLDGNAESTTFAVWNDTHENPQTLRKLHELTESLEPDFLLWNGDQSNDVHFERDMTGQYLAPQGLAIADRWPLAYVRGNHDVRGPAARSLPKFTGTPEDRYYYAFRSGPVAALVMDTGEDKPDDSHYFGGLAAFQPLQERQAEWLKEVVAEPWFREAPFKVLFCHIPLWWVRDIFPEHRRWEFHPFCRQQWLPTLVDAGVKVVVSGHTHDYRWLPATDQQPLGQLIGGGPQPGWATFIEGRATRERMTLRMTKLDGTVVAEAAFEA